MNLDDGIWNFKKYPYVILGIVLTLITISDQNLFRNIIRSIWVIWILILLGGFIYLILALFGSETHTIDSNFDLPIKYALITIGFLIGIVVWGFYITGGRNYLLIPVILGAIIFVYSTNKYRVYSETTDQFTRGSDYFGRNKRL